jgi:hypothetical protein
VEFDELEGVVATPVPVPVGAVVSATGLDEDTLLAHMPGEEEPLDDESTADVADPLGAFVCPPHAAA